MESPCGHTSGKAQLLEHQEIEKVTREIKLSLGAAEATELVVVLMARMDLTPGLT
jgi:hypothetical protein